MKCNASLLQALVQQSIDPGDDAEAIAGHLETCVRCQQTLTELGGDKQWWNDARDWLSIAPDDVMPSAQCCPLPPIDLSFLETPTHPEMLGRIGRYEVESVLGRGGMGVVLRAYDSDLHRSVAIKVLAPEWAASIPARQRFAREAQAAASVAHENVIPIYNVAADATLPYLVMRYVPGMTLQRWVTTHGPPDVASILRIAGQLAEGLAAAHRRGLVHRDIKPGNVMVGENIDRIWLTDFGLARAADSVTLTQTGIIAGTPNYMSPEQARGENVDHQSDLFSLGCLLYFLATGRPPFESENTLAVLHRIVTDDAQPLAMHRQDLPPAFTRLVHRLLHRQRSKRPADCEAVISELGVAQMQLDAGRTARVPFTKRTRRLLWAGGLVACIGLIVAMSPLQTLDPNRDSNGDDGRRISAGNRDGNRQTRPQAIQVSPYINQAASQIENAAWLDSRQLQIRIEKVDALVNRMKQAEPTDAVPGMQLSNQQWRNEINRLEHLIRLSQQR
ncbi:serine/threonine-protein kinase [Stieleria varia]|uniref:non-specific serine/threonine protein kinase n=1 Tax=Stieleria varia TaxID=2528005 RepID=A0A5C6B3B6_9BACT|nr:serine/threonine-protein kinase [Stieleria varia]TWU06390.1 Serine/threonine-protein kinase PknB [Stieleria varia]